MFKFSPAFNIDSFKAGKKGRYRVVGEYLNEGYLISVNTTTHTFIYLETVTNESTLVMSFKSYIDIITAELTDDQEFLFFTERIIENTKYKFRTTIWHIYSLSKQQIYEGQTPMIGYFLPRIATKYQIITINNQRIEQNEITFNDKKIKISSKRGGILIKDATRWFFSRDPMYLAVFRAKKLFEMYKFDNHGKCSYETFPIHENKEAIIPPELALYPTIPKNLIAFKFTRSNMYVFPFGNDIGIIEQIYQGFNSVLTFAISTIRTKYYEIIPITGIDPDYPISFIQNGKIVFLFVVNLLAAFVDFNTTPPVFFLLPTKFAYGPLSSLSTNLGTSKTIVDINDFKVYKCEFDMQHISKDIDLTDKSILSILAILSSRLPYDINIPLLLDKLSGQLDISLCMYFFEWFFAATLAICTSNKKSKSLKSKKKSSKAEKSLKIPHTFISAIDDIESEFPSSGPITRSQQFKNIILRMIEVNGKSESDLCPDKALKILRHHNETILVLRSALDRWLEKYRPDDMRIFLVSMSLMSEARIASAPNLPSLGSEIEYLANKLCSKQLYESLQAHEVFGNTALTTEMEHEEQEYWSRRFESNEIHQKEHFSSITLPRSNSSYSLPYGPHFGDSLQFSSSGSMSSAGSFSV